MCRGRALCDVVGVNIVQAVQAKYRLESDAKIFSRCSLVTPRSTRLNPKYNAGLRSLGHYSDEIEP